ncbi:hypothetical protein [Hymenobacter canadensis]|uniref:DUF5723 domain-containing protein n=1 Tax=Hymenobacter canadensis TaxID=2999067 RepID=A0ABY7LXN4_9BACT|nr:hypothetical protein [Hymenobacter canadensis]WBA44281.1 hypothetical protein O3303_21640 [Hymenobacter canadensis]
MTRTSRKGIVLFSCCLLTHVSWGQNLLNLRSAGSSISLNNGPSPTTAKDTSAKEKEEAAKATKVILPSSLGILAFSTLEKKAEASYYSYFNPNGKHSRDFFIGVTGSAEIKNSIANVFSSGNLVTGAGASLRLGILLKTNRIDWAAKLAGVNEEPDREVRLARRQALLDTVPPAWDLWLVGNGGLTGSAFKLFLPNNAFDKQIKKQGFTGTDFSIGLNYWQARVSSINSTILSGVTIGRKRDNNFNKLEESTREDTRTLIDSVTKVTRKVVTKETIYTGNYKEETIYPLNLDFYFVPLNLENVGFLASNTMNFSASHNTRVNPSFGVFFLKERNPFNPVAGFTFGYYDLFDTDSSDDDKRTTSKIAISIAARINLVSSQLRK